MSNKILLKKIIRKTIITLSVAVCLCIPLGGCGKSDDLSMEITMVDDTQTEPETQAGQTVGEHIYVYVCGAVIKSGVYEMARGSRLYEAIDMAGGMKDEADQTYLNMARELVDGEQIVVYTKDEVLELQEEEKLVQAAIEEAKSGLVNINTAGVSELVTLSGIGESRAQAIIDYREKNGAFGSIEDIKNVDGIKDGLFSKIKDKITV